MGQKFIYTKLTVSLNSLEHSRNVYYQHYVWRKNCFKPKNTLPTVKHVGGSTVLGGYFTRKGPGALQKIRHHEEVGLSKNIEATRQDISQKVKT